MSKDVGFIQCRVPECQYRWNWRCRATCFRCSVPLGLPPAKPHTPKGAWADPVSREDTDSGNCWQRAKAGRWRRRGPKSGDSNEAQLNSDKPQGTEAEKAMRLVTELKRLSAFSGSAELASLEEKATEAKKAARESKPLSAQAKTLEKKIEHKQRTHAAAVERSAQARKLLESAQEAVQRADAEQKERAAELKALQADLKAMQARVEADGQESTGNSENAPTTASLLGPVCQEFSQKPEIAEKLAAADAILAEVRALAAAASPEAPSPAPPVQQQQEQQQQQQLPSSDAQGQGCR